MYYLFRFSGNPTSEVEYQLFNDFDEYVKTYLVEHIIASKLCSIGGIRYLIDENNKLIKTSKRVHSSPSIWVDMVSLPYETMEEYIDCCNDVGLRWDLIIKTEDEDELVEKINELVFIEELKK